jgi:hypothetical protein
MDSTGSMDSSSSTGGSTGSMAKGTNMNTKGVLCTMEMKTCPDGSMVGRMPPKCEFGPCPSKCICGKACKIPKTLKNGICNRNGLCKLGKKKAPICG